MKILPQLKSLTKKTKKGFTLIEVIAVLVLLGILAAIAVPKYVDMAENARNRAIDAGVSELNGRESLTWSNVKLSQAGWVDDATTFALVDTDLEGDYSYNVAATVAGATLEFQTATVPLTRTASTDTSPGRWAR
ncbi:MAG: prepilin-type N-terminal cleavage/methylation domain-containing protein [Akkermansiaceae bacterium]|jgi:prepilin-type N-terminal cleavage/methylation domain-containing protein